eukprot:GEMP01037656.1.p1 GENE.GEMP01037656.1~~GEMP01037656.1.p1  ORF type:complete len:402 (+),score=79.21 GEMP01037656.1:44-1249(+)
MFLFIFSQCYFIFCSAMTTPAERLTRCPEELPFAYNEGNFCCKTGQSANSTTDALCNGGPLTYASSCCFEQAYANCTAPPCVSSPAEVHCGKDVRANFCNDCGSEDQCSGDCEWRMELCQPKRPVNCGDHVAEICADCPRGRGADKCGGDCEWTNDTCSLRLDSDGMKWDVIIVLAFSIVFFLLLLCLIYISWSTKRKEDKIRAMQKKEEEEAHERYVAASAMIAKKQTSSASRERQKGPRVMKAKNKQTSSASELRKMQKKEDKETHERFVAPKDMKPKKQTSFNANLNYEPEALGITVAGLGEAKEQAMTRQNRNLDDSPGRKSRVALRSDQVYPGKKVVRGPDWEFGEQDGGTGNVGIVGAVPCRGWVMVKWKATGGMHAYKTGQDGVHHLSPAPKGF